MNDGHQNLVLTTKMNFSSKNWGAEKRCCDLKKHRPNLKEKGSVRLRILVGWKIYSRHSEANPQSGG